VELLQEIVTAARNIRAELKLDPKKRVPADLYTPADSTVALIAQLARQSSSWGYQRIQGELLKLGHRVGASTIRRVLTRLRIPPAPTRDTDTSWRQFLRTQASTMVACDFFHVECAVTLRRIYVFFVIEIDSRYVHIVGLTTHPDGPWTTQQARNLLADIGDRAGRFRYLVRDRAGQFARSFDAVLADSGINVIQIPPRCPQANCFAERFVGTVRAELTDRMLIFGQRHLRLLLNEYVRHYNTQRPHRGQQLRPPRPEHTTQERRSEHCPATDPRRPHQRISTSGLNPEHSSVAYWNLHRLDEQGSPASCHAAVSARCAGVSWTQVCDSLLHCE
jgi:transposase InsO family protein